MKKCFTSSNCNSTYDPTEPPPNEATK